jgi:hypothetical protein
MGKINWARVLLGGLLAGIILAATDFFTNGVALGHEWEAAVQALGRTMSPGAMVVFVIWGFVAGTSVVWLYAAARPRFGPGVKTAVLTGFAFWIFGYALPSLGQWGFGLFPRRLLVMSTLAGLLEVILASVAGAWVYRE